MNITFNKILQLGVFSKIKQFSFMVTAFAKSVWEVCIRMPYCFRFSSKFSYSFDFFVLHTGPYNFNVPATEQEFFTFMDITKVIKYQSSVCCRRRMQ